ncbi:hypothetical protein LSAT2_030919 [Lamellibrachia satsuma]|nr:hypothetical protein LSAT2_030919 [Lamellibrachia satsuma]
MQRLRTNPDNYYSSEAELVSAIKLKIKITHAKLSKILRTFRDDPVQVGVSTHGPVGFYSDPSADGSRPGKFIVNVWRLDTKPKFVFDALILHEAEPGHHLQTLAAMRDSIPYFRQLIEFWNYAYVPFNWRFYTSCSEGWALYAEAVGEELDAYTAPYSLFGRYSSEVTRAVRLVVDTGLHALKWSKQRAIDYMREHTTLALGSIEAEVTRYISAPGQVGP